jgi:Acetyltransferase (GNAT) domain
MGNEAFVKVLRGVPELEEIRAVWESWPGNRDSELGTQLAFLHSHPETIRPHVVAVYRGGLPDAILVGRIDRGHLTCRLGYLSASPRAQILCFVAGAYRGHDSRENCELMVDSVMKSLSQGEADVAYMNFLRQGSDLCELSLKKPGVLGRDYVRDSQPHFRASLPSTVEEFYQNLSSKARKNLRYQAKRLIKEFPDSVKIHCYREVAELEKMYQDVEQVAKKSYQRGLGVGFVDTPGMRAGLRRMAEKGWFRAYVLYIQERPCAFWIGDINRDTFGSDYVGFDADFAKHSPGMFLITKVIEGFCDANREGVTAVDFGPGHAQYKEVLSTQNWHETCVYIFAPSLKGMSLNLLRSSIEGLEQIAKKLLARTNLLQKIKKRWRAARSEPKEAAQVSG